MNPFSHAYDAVHLSHMTPPPPHTLSSTEKIPTALEPFSARSNDQDQQMYHDIEYDQQYQRQRQQQHQQQQRQQQRQQQYYQSQLPPHPTSFWEQSNIPSNPISVLIKNMVDGEDFHQQADMGMHEVLPLIGDKLAQRALQEEVIGHMGRLKTALLVQEADVKEDLRVFTERTIQRMQHMRKEFQLLEARICSVLQAASI